MRVRVNNCGIVLPLTVLLLTVFLSACDGVNFIADWPPAAAGETPPFVITRPVIEITERQNYFTYAGLVFNFLNTAEENVDRITVSFMLFDAKSQASPFVGSNKFEITKFDIVVPNENKEIIFSLDRFVYIAPTEPYLVDFFYISEVHYTNGLAWQDKYGKYRVRW